MVLLLNTIHHLCIFHMTNLFSSSFNMKAYWYCLYVTFPCISITDIYIHIGTHFLPYVTLRTINIINFVCVFLFLSNFVNFDVLRKNGKRSNVLCRLSIQRERNILFLINVKAINVYPISNMYLTEPNNLIGFIFTLAIYFRCLFKFIFTL